MATHLAASSLCCAVATQLMFGWVFCPEIPSCGLVAADANPYSLGWVARDLSAMDPDISGVAQQQFFALLKIGDIVASLFGVLPLSGITPQAFPPTDSCGHRIPVNTHNALVS